MTDQTTRDLGREVAEAVVSMGKLKRETMQEGHYNDLIDYGILVNFHQDIWITILDGDEVLSEMHPDYPHDLNACARDLMVAGYRFELLWLDDSWLARYKEKVGRKHWEAIIETIETNEQPAVAWCESFLALKSYVEAKGER